MKYLRQYIRKTILKEARFSELGSLCLYKTHSYASGEKLYILFKPELIDEIIGSKDPLEPTCGYLGRHSKNLLGGVLLESWTDSKMCHGAWEVTKGVADDGYGPVIYDIAMADNPEGIFADRSSVSDDAYGLWKFYREKRWDVDAIPMVLKTRKWTDDPGDDCYWGSEGEHFYGDTTNPDLSYKHFLSDPLNYVYKRKPMSTMKSLELRSKKVLDRLKDKIPHFDSYWWTAMFNARFWSR